MSPNSLINNILKKIRLSTKLILIMSLFVIFICLLLGVISYKISAAALRNETEQSLLSLAEQGSFLVRSELDTIQASIEAIANRRILTDGTDENILYGILQAESERIGFEAFGLADTSGHVRLTTGFSTNISDREYFRRALSGESVISDLLISRDTGLPVIVFAVPVMDNNTIRGVLFGISDGNKLSELTNNIKYGKEGYAFMVNGRGTNIAHPNPDLVLLKYNVIEDSKKRPEFRVLADIMKTRMIKGEHGYARYFFNESYRHMGFSPVPGTDWSFAIATTEREVLLGLNNLWKNIMFTTFIILFAGIVISACVAKLIIRPILDLRSAVMSMSEGDLEIKAKLGGTLEIRELADCFNKMGDRLKEHIKLLKQEVITRQSIESELNIASKIQKSILPTTFPPFPHRKEFELYAFMKPAKVIGGDFYDFFLKDDDRLFFVIADVSGKGVPAALFMMVCRTLLHSLARSLNDPAEILEKANNLLSFHNEAEMFVTVFTGFYQLETGELSYSNGGHSPAIIVGDKGIKEITTNNSTALGFLQGLKYQTESITLEKNDKIVLYTDGVLDACNENGSFFGLERFLKVLSDSQNLNSQEMTDQIINQLSKYQCKNQYDDITLMIVQNLKKTL